MSLIDYPVDTLLPDTLLGTERTELLLANESNEVIQAIKKPSSTIDYCGSFYQTPRPTTPNQQFHSPQRTKPTTPFN